MVPDPVRHASLDALAAGQRPVIAGHEIEIAAHECGWGVAAQEVGEGGRDVAAQEVQVFVQAQRGQLGVVAR